MSDDEEQLPPDLDYDHEAAARALWEGARERGLTPDKALGALLASVGAMVGGWQEVFHQGELDTDDRFKAIALAEVLANMSAAIAIKRGMFSGPGVAAIELTPEKMQELREQTGDNPIDFLRALFGDGPEENDD